MDIFADEIRRNPYPLYDQLRGASPVLKVPPPFDAWMIFDYDGVKWALSDHETFSSRVPAPPWFIFLDPPVHTKLRALISKAFTPKMITNLEPRIRELSRELLDGSAGRREMDLATEFSIPLPMQVIGEMIGIPIADWMRYKRWTDAIMQLSYTRSGDAEAERGLREFRAASAEMAEYLSAMIVERRASPRDDLLTRLIDAEVDGQRLSPQEILAFFQLLIVAGQETTTNLINNALLALMENPDQFQLLRANPDLAPMAIDEVLRSRAPLQWLMRTPTRDVQWKGQTIPKGALLLPMVGSANRDPAVFPAPERFDIRRDPNPHVGFGHGIHFCLGAPLARMEARIALGDILSRFRSLEYGSDEPWQPRQALNVYGPTRLPVRFEVYRQSAAGN